MSLPCCFTDSKTPFCEGRRHEQSAMCLRHTKETIRRSIIDGSIPLDCMRELVEFTDWYVKVKEMNRNYELGAAFAAAHTQAAREQRAEQAKQNVVYYVQLTGSRIKIGWTGNLEQRLRSYRSRASDLLAIELGGQPVEARRHKQFAHLRIGRSEDFCEAPDLLAHIASLRQEAA